MRPPVNPELPPDLLAALNYAVFVRAEGDAFQLAAAPPAWLTTLWPQVTVENGFHSAMELSPFLDNFLIDASAFWETGSGKGPSSGTWIERNSVGHSTALEATAFKFEDRSILLIEDLGRRHQERTATLQVARETALAYERLNQEIQKRQVLVHCVVNDMAAQLSNLITSLRLIDLENPALKVRKLTSLASRAAQKQQELINRVFETFVREPDSLHGGTAAGGSGADVAALIRKAIAAAGASAQKQSVAFAVTGLPTGGEPPLRVSAEPGNFERLLDILLEDAIRHSPIGKTVVVSVAADADVVLVSIEDECVDVPKAVRGAGLNNFANPETPTNENSLAIHFCRIAVDTWGGEIGCVAREPAGNKFWFRLPRVL